MAKDLFMSLDLNLLKILIVLSQELNMRLAAERLHVTQPAVSQSLKKLRQHFNDELFIKTPRGLEPTSYANTLLNSISPVMHELASAVNEHEVFDPQQINETINIALAPHLSNFLGIKLFNIIHEQAPNVSIQLINWNQSTLDNISKGILHLGINLELPQSPKEIMYTKIIEDNFTMYVRSGHPLADGRDIKTLKDVSGYDFATSIIPDWNAPVSHAERLLKLVGYQANVCFRSDNPNTILDVVRSTDMLHPASSFIDKQDLEGLSSFQVKLSNKHLNYPIGTYYCQRNRRSPLLNWLNDIVYQALTQ